MGGCKGYKWYNNGIESKCLLECPSGWVKGRLPISEETRRKMSESSWTKKASKEELNERNKKISSTIQSRTSKEKEEFAKHVSNGRKGKGLGIIPWNKNKRGLQVAWNKGIPMTEEDKQKLRDAYKNLTQEEKERRSEIISRSNKNKVPWNKGVHYTLDAITIKEMKIKEYNTRKENNSFTLSNLEEVFYDALINIYGKDDIIRQYSSDKYPFMCDFYIISEDKYIELNGNWTHGGRPYDENDESCRLQLERWQEKAKSSDYYKNAIYTWTDLDVRKRNIAKENNLNYEVYYEFN